MSKKISGYRLMWMMVMFDLPVLTAAETKEATNFRKTLLDLGFEMVQFSVYARFIGTKEKSARYVRELKANLPRGGKVEILFFTDKQYSSIISLHGREEFRRKGKPDKYLQF